MTSPTITGGRAPLWERITVVVGLVGASDALVVVLIAALVRALS